MASKRSSKAAGEDLSVLLRLLADIRAAVGDPTGKLMQDELVARCRHLKAMEDHGNLKSKVMSEPEEELWTPSDYERQSFYRMDMKFKLVAALLPLSSIKSDLAKLNGDARLNGTMNELDTLMNAVESFVECHSDGIKIPRP